MLTLDPRRTVLAGLTILAIAVVRVWRRGRQRGAHGRSQRSGHRRAGVGRTARRRRPEPAAVGGPVARGSSSSHTAGSHRVADGLRAHAARRLAEHDDRTPGHAAGRAVGPGLDMRTSWKAMRGPRPADDGRLGPSTSGRSGGDRRRPRRQHEHHRPSRP